MTATAAAWLVLPVLLLLPGAVWAVPIGRACRLRARWIPFLSAVFSLASTPLLLYNLSLLHPLRDSSSLAVAAAALIALCACLALSLLRVRPPRRSPSVADRRRRWTGIPSLLAMSIFLAASVALPFLSAGAVRGDKLLIPWICDWHFELGVMNGILEFGLPGTNIFAKTDQPLLWHFFSMIQTAVAVLFSGRALRPAAVSVALNAVYAPLLLVTLVFVLTRRYRRRDVSFAVVCLFVFSCWDFIPFVILNAWQGRPNVIPTTHPYLPDGWDCIEQLRVFSPYAYAVWQPRHIPAGIFLLCGLVFLSLRRRAPMLLGTATGFLLAASTGYSIPIAMNSAFVTGLLLAVSFAMDRGRDRRLETLKFAAAAIATGAALASPFLVNFLRSGQDSSLVLRGPERGTLRAFLAVQFGPLLFLGFWGLALQFVSRRRTGLDVFAALALTTTCGLMLTVRRTIGGVLDHNDFGMKTSLIVWAGLAYFAAHASEAARRRSPPVGPVGVGERIRLYAYGAAVPVALFLLSRAPALVLWAIPFAIALSEWLLRARILPPVPGLRPLMVSFLLCAANLAYDIDGHRRALRVDRARHEALAWIRANTPGNAIVQGIPVDDWDIPVFAGRRTYIGYGSHVFTRRSTFLDHCDRIEAVGRDPDPASRWRALRDLGVDYVLTHSPPQADSAWAHPGFVVLRRWGPYGVLRIAAASAVPGPHGTTDTPERSSPSEVSPPR